MSNHPEMPLVVPNDDGIRPAGKPDECFYCNRKVGEPHQQSCVCAHKKVVLRYSFEVEIDVPWSWSEEDILFHRNESTWCSNNGLREIDEQAHRDNPGVEDPCPCNRFKAEFVRTVDETPRGKVRDE